MKRYAKDEVDTALYVITHPNEFADQPAVRATAWAMAMEARGNRVDLDRLGIPAVHPPRDYRNATPLADDLALRSPRVIQRVADRMAALAAPTAPHGGDAA